MAMGPLALVLMVGFTLFAVLLILSEVTSLGGRLAWLALLTAGIALAPTGAAVVAPIVVILVLGAKSTLDRARGSAA